jgi:hypothetical protein
MLVLVGSPSDCITCKLMLWGKVGQRFLVGGRLSLDHTTIIYKINTK